MMAGWRTIICGIAAATRPKGLPGAIRPAARLIGAVVVLFGFGVMAAGQVPDHDYRWALMPDHSVTVTRGGHSASFRPVFTIIRAATDPALALSRPSADMRGTDPTSTEGYALPSWTAVGGGRTDVIYRAGTAITVTAMGAALVDGGVAWTFAQTPDFTLRATLHTPSPGREPAIRFVFTARTPGWYSVGYAGGPEVDPAAADEFLQPLIWQEKRFPRAPLTTAEMMGGLPLALVSRDGATVGVAADPSESPFRMPNLENSRFGMILRTPEGRARPGVFAPLFGQARSRMAAGDTTTFTLRAIVSRGDVHRAFQDVARGLFAFRGLRENLSVSLNDTLSNMIDFAMDDHYSGWNADLKGFDYKTDVAGTVKVVSALHPLGIALVRDDPEIWRRRALPMTEYLMSREKYLYTTDPSITRQGPSHNMAGPSAEVSELAALFAMTGRRNPVFRDYALALAKTPRRLNLNMVSDGDSFAANLALYRLTGDKARLARAVTLADSYVANRIDMPQTDFADVRLEQGGQFWSDYGSKWIDLFELWQESGEQRFLAAAAKGARQFSQYAWFFPTIPDGTITVDRGGAPRAWQRSVRTTGMDAPERTMPAWQASQIGLTPEAANTYPGNPAVMLTHFAPYFLRIADATGDAFLRDVATSAVIGRYTNFPGYDINGSFSAVYSRADYPLRPFEEFTYNQLYYNHVWPHIALLLDYLVSDAEVRSKGAITFPSRYAQGYAYLQSKVYGDRPGRFFGQGDVRLWMPKGLVAISDAQINHVAGYSKAGLHLALMNAAPRATVARLRFNPEITPFAPDRDYVVEIWTDGVRGRDRVLRGGVIDVLIPASGMTAITVRNLPTHARLQPSVFATPPFPAAGTHRLDRTAFGDVTGMLIALGSDRKQAFVWLKGSEREIGSARLSASVGGRHVSMIDTRHPFEFSFPVQADGGSVTYHLDVDRPDGSTVRTTTYDLTTGTR